MSKVKWIAVGVVSIFLLIVFALPTPEPEPEPTPTPQPSILVETRAKQYFMEGCTEEANEEDCECMWGRLRSRFTINEIIELSENTESEATQDAIIDAAFYCTE